VGRNPRSPASGGGSVAGQLHSSCRMRTSGQLRVSRGSIYDDLRRPNGRSIGIRSCSTSQGEAQIAETVYGGRRLIVCRTRLLGAQAELWLDWRHFCFISNRDEEIALVEGEHRDHAVVEQVIADLKDQALTHFPSGDFNANGAWTVLAALAHNLLRSTQLLGLPDTTVRAARTLRRWLPPGPRPPDPPRRRLDAAPPSPLALARRLHQRAQPHRRAPRPGLTARRANRQRVERSRPQSTSPAARRHPNNASTEAPTSPYHPRSQPPNDRAPPISQRGRSHPAQPAPSVDPGF
jgi:hypothetical protein